MSGLTTPSYESSGGSDTPQNVRWFGKSDSAVQWPLRINIDNLGICIFARKVNFNLDPQAFAQWDRRRDECSVKVDDDGLTFAGQGFGNTLSLNHDPQRNSSASSGVTNDRLGGDPIP